MTDTRTYKTRVRAKGQVTMPAPIRAALGADEGDDLLFSIANDSSVIITASKTIPAEQAWFWNERWQKMEREAQADIDAGRVVHFTSVDEAVKALDHITDAGD